MDKKKQQLGMNPSTASHRLVKDLLYEYGVVRQHKRCFHCGEPMSREDFSIEHITPWLDSDNPVELYFDLDNVDFSHHCCNLAAARKPTKIHETKAQRNAAYWKRRAARVPYSPDERRKRYLRNGN